MEKTMNSEQLICQAGTAIAVWEKYHNTGCRLYIRDGRVYAKSDENSAKPGDPELYIGICNIKHGLSVPQWNILGSALLNLYNKEVACQARQKP